MIYAKQSVQCYIDFFFFFFFFDLRETKCPVQPESTEHPPAGRKKNSPQLELYPKLSKEQVPIPKCGEFYNSVVVAISVFACLCTFVKQHPERY